MAFSIREFAAATQEGLAREAHFEMQINLPNTIKGDAKQLSILCSSVTLPSRQAEISQIRRSGQGILSPYVTGLTYAPLEVTFYCDAKGNTIKTLQSWMDSMMQLKAVGDLYMVQYKANYTADIILNQYASDGTGIASYHFYTAFPSNLGSINFSWASRDSLVLVPATFAYTYYDIGGTPPKSVPNISTTPQAGKVNRLPVTGDTPID